MNGRRRGWARMPGELAVLVALALTGAWATAQWHPRRAALVAAAQAEPPSITAAETRDLAAGGAEIVWVDARPAEDFARGSLPGAVSLPEAEFEARIPALLEVWQPDALVVVFCDSRACGTSRAVARRLRGEFALGDVRVLADGVGEMTNDQ